MKFFIIFVTLIIDSTIRIVRSDFYDYATMKKYNYWTTENDHEVTNENFETTTYHYKESTEHRRLNKIILPVPFGDCDETKNLTTLNLSYTGMTQVNNKLIKNADVSCLNFSNNRIDFIESLFLENLPNLTYLNLGYNFLNLEELNLNPNFAILGLKTLILDNNLMNQTSELRLNDCLNNLEVLYIRQMKISFLSAKCDLKNLKYLYLSYNHFSTENDILNGENYFNLSHLYVDSNSIRSFNGTRFSNLELLQLDNNDIQVLCNRHCYGSELSLGKMLKLKHLSLSTNQIQNVHSDAFFDTINLESIDLSNNYIETIENDTFKRLEFLKILMLNDNELTILPNFHHFSKIEIMNFSSNKLKNVTSKQFFRLKSLKTLSLSNNEIMNVEKQSFMELSTLFELDLSNNTIEHLPKDWMKPQNTLRILNLNLNYFTNFDQLSLDNAQFLEKIFLRNNLLEELNVMSFVNIKKNASIFIKYLSKY